MVAVAAALLVGCGETAEPATSPRSETSVASATSSPSASPSEAPASLRPTPSTSRGDVTVTGRIVEGVEPGCLVLRAENADYLLILPRGTDRAQVTVGETVAVRGRLASELATTCQQGTPLVVAEIRPA